LGVTVCRGGAMHGRIISNFALKFVVVGLPAIGIFLADSTLWNVIWWTSYVLIGLWWAKHEIVTKTVIGTIWAQIPLILLSELHIRSPLAWGAAGVWLVLVYWHTYRQAIVMNRAMGAENAGMHVSGSV
jgi:hypothetical protein